MEGVAVPADQPADPPGPLDAVARDLQALRTAQGLPSYGELAVRVARLRQDRGMTAASARVGRTTVYDVFRTGRRRVDVLLVADLVRVLGGDEEEAARWVTRCTAALVASPVEPVEPLRPPQAPAALSPQLSPQPSPQPSPRPSPEETPAEPVPAEPDEAVVPASGAVRRRPRWVVPAVVTACVLVNLAGRVLVDALHLSVYLDMVGTAFAAIVLGPWTGALVGAVTNVAGVSSSGPASLPFALVNVVGALVWGYGVRRFGMGRSVPRFFLLNLVTAVACTAVAVPIIAARFGGGTGHGADDVTYVLLSYSDHLGVALTSANLLTSVSDKLIAGFVALAAIEVVPRAVVARLPGTWMGAGPLQRSGRQAHAAPHAVRHAAPAGR